MYMYACIYMRMCNTLLTVLVQITCKNVEKLKPNVFFYLVGKVKFKIYLLLKKKKSYP